MVPIKVKRSTPFEKMFVAYRGKFHLSEGDIRFVAHGVRLKPSHTPQEVVKCLLVHHTQGYVLEYLLCLQLQHELEDGDEVAVMIEMFGGCLMV